MIQNRILLLLVFLFAAILLIPMVHADLINPSITYVYFDKDGVPYNGTVQYTITCYGYSSDSFPHVTYSPGLYQPSPAFRYSASCKEYGCPVYEPYYLQYTTIDWCSLDGVANSRNFTIQNFSKKPYSRCDDVSARASRIGGLQKYYYGTPEYVSCKNFEKKTAGQWTVHNLNFSKINTMTRSTTVLQLPGRNLLYGILPYQPVTINRSDVDMNLEEYIAYLETCRVSTDPACPGWIADGIPLKSISEYRTLKKNATLLKENPCDTYLLEADPSLVMPFTDYMPWDSHWCDSNGNDPAPCNLTDMICESRFTIPSAGNPGNSGVRTIPGMPTPAGSADIHRSPV